MLQSDAEKAFYSSSFHGKKELGIEVFLNTKKRPHIASPQLTYSVVES